MTISNTSAVLRTVDDLRGPAGRLEALLNSGLQETKYAALVCHPHPLGGGTMHNKVAYAAMKAFQSLGVPVLRFNFRGTGLSEGVHDHGRGERDDVRAALDWLKHEFGLPVLFAGFSFGANVGMHVCCGDPDVAAMIGLGLPVHAEGRDYHYEFLRDCTQPTLFISGTKDQYGPVAKVEEAVALTKGPKQMVWISDADHFFAGKLDEVRAAMIAWIKIRFPSIDTP
jgi:alpha/beta superfamily hydrolase